MFGNIALSMQQVEDVAEGWMSQGLSLNMKIFMDEKEAFKVLEENIKDAMAYINNLNWRVKLYAGFTFDDNSQKEAFDTISAFINDSIDFVEQQRYLTYIAVDVLFDTNSNYGAEMKALTDSIYSETYTEMVKWAIS